MNVNMIEKLYILSFTLDGEPWEMVKAITESFRKALDFKKVLVYKQVQDGFLTVASSPLPNVCRSSLFGLKSNLVYNILNSSGKKNGELYMLPKSGKKPTQRQERLIAAFTAQLGALMDRIPPGSAGVSCPSDEIARYRDLAAKDALTGLYNRNHFEECASRLEKNGTRPVSIIMVDMDGLKLINDTLGHSYGDGALIATAGLLKKTFRREDIIVRLGGDEFVVLLPGAPASIVEDRCMVLEEALKKYNRKNKSLPIHFSVGFATSAGPADTIKRVLEEADKNMYRQKQRNHLYFMDHLRSAYLSFRTVSMEGAAVV